jgi:flagellar hook-length control protein FliK
MIVSLITNDSGVAGPTDWLAKTGLESNKPSVNAVEPSFVQIMTSLDKGVVPTPAQMDMAGQGSEQSPAPQGIGSLDLAITDQDSAQFLLAMVAPVGSAKVILDPQIAVAAAGMTSVQAANGDAAGDDLPVALVLDAALAFGDQPSDFWTVAQITQAKAEPVDPDMMADQTIGFRPVVTAVPPVDPQHLVLSSGEIVLPITALAAVSPNDDGTSATAIDLGFDDNGLPVLDGTRLALDGAVDVSFTQIPDGPISDSVKKMTPDGWKLTGDQMSYNVTYAVVGMDAGPGLDPLPYTAGTADNAVTVLQTGPLGLQSDVFNPVLKMDARPGAVVTVLAAAVNGADPQSGPVGPVAVDQSPEALPSTPQGQAGLPTPVATPDLFASAARGQSADTDVMPLQTGPSGEAAGDAQENVVTQQLAARAATATPGNGAASPYQADGKQGSGVAQQDMMPAISPDHATSAIQVSKAAQLVAGASLGAVQQATVQRQPLPLTFGPDPLPPTMTLIDIASGGAGSMSQGGSGQTGAGVAGQGAASLLGQMEAALDVRQQGWTKTLVNRAINAAQAGGSLTIKILPAHLGQITLKLSEGKRGTDLRIIADVPATAAMLRDVQDQLSSAFESAGLTLGAYSASTGNNGGEGSQKDGYTDQVASSELAIDAVQGADDIAGVDNLSRINILL